MAFVGPLHNRFGVRPVAAFCEDCNTNLLVWRCYNCVGQYCGRSICQHRIVPGASVEDVDLGWVSGNEVAEGMHAICWRHFQRLGSEMAIKPAGAHELLGGVYLCS